MAQEPAQEVTSDGLKQLSALAKQVNNNEALLEELEQRVKEVKAQQTALLEEDIPFLMKELEIESFRLEDGSSVTVGDDVYAGIPVTEKENAFKWLEENGFGSLIKTEVTVTFGRAELERAIEFSLKLREEGMEPEVARGIHHQTLKAQLREWIAAARPFPMELFGARPVRLAKIVAPKKPRKKKGEA